VIEVLPVPRPDWSPLPHEGCVGVEGRVLLGGGDLLVAMLRFEPGGTIHPHAAGHAIDVICLDGRARVRVGDETADLPAGHRVHWPAGVEHCLWTEPERTATTLMVERLAG
jgi:quercetin dioxygenase-like cupin family protein